MTKQNTTPTSDNVVWHHATVTRSRREVQNGHHGGILWFTGLSGSGKSTLAHGVESIRCIGEVAKLFMEAGVIVLTAFISPFRTDRDKVRAMVEAGEFIEIYCQCPIELCEQRDVKGLYKKARAGEIAQFTGVSSPYEAPEHPELIVDTMQTLEQNVQQIIAGFAEKLTPEAVNLISTVQINIAAQE